MQPEFGAPDKPVIHLPLPRYVKWAVRVWVVLLLLSPFLVFFRFSILQMVVLAAVLGGFGLPFFLGRLPGELEAASEREIFLNPRAQRYAWLYLLGKDNSLANPQPRSFLVPDTSLQWEAQRLSLTSGDDCVMLGHGAQMEPVRDWLVRRGIHPGRPQ
jgi:hypothetical protein